MTIVGVIDSNSDSTLEQYLAKKKDQFVKGSGQEVAADEIRNLRNDLFRLSGRINSFLSDSAEREDSHLVLGKVQSGKTAHMLGVVASLVDTSCSLVILVSGVTGQLTRQTQKRLEKDIGNLPNMQVNVLPVPTIRDLDRADSTFIDDLSQLVGRRISTGSNPLSTYANLPVLAMMENVHRVEALRKILNELRDAFSNDLQVVIIDDEADQASPNAEARNGDESTIYGLLRQIRQSGIRNCLLSYTATPQAVLLAVKDSALKPRHCCVITPGQQYFGIEDVCREESSHRLIELTDVPSASQTDWPKSLREAFLDFLIIACIRRQAPELFFSCDERLNASGYSNIPNSNSLQMLIHPSGRQSDHTKYYKWIQAIKKEVEEALGYRVHQPSSEFISRELQPSYDRVLLQSEVGPNELPREIPEHWVADIIANLVGSTGLVVVNANPDRPSAGDSMPVEDDGWESKRQWILIGGDILGRGVTMPNLVSTYFLRSPQVTNFDTLSQQMRFCGYRSRYKKFVCIYAPGAIIKRFNEADVVDRVIFQYALKWDRDNIDLIRNPPQIMHAQRGQGNFRPTRPGVLDRSIKSQDIGDVPFAARNVLLPNVAIANAGLLMELIGDSSPEFLTRASNWAIYPNFSIEKLGGLWRWSCIGERDRSNLDASQTVFDAELQEAGLSGLPLILAVRGKGILSMLARRDDPESYFSSDLIEATSFRSLLKTSRSGLQSQNTQQIRNQWISAYRNPSGPIDNWILNGEMQYEGDPQRRLRDNEVTPKYGNSVIFVVEPIFILDAPKNEGGDAIGLGVELAIMGPKNFKLVSWTVPQ
jgi:hypothetical protein